MNCNNLKIFAEKMDINLDKQALDRFSKYLELLIAWNEKINLTAITDPLEIQIKHFLDSILILRYCDINENAKLIDIGTGAGFPGVPLKIARTDINLTLLDSLNKRLLFLKDLLEKLNLDSELLHLRAEEGSRQNKYRENFDVVTSRAVAPMNVLLEYCMPYVKKDGLFIAMKGPAVKEEIKNAKNAIKLLGGDVLDIKEFELPEAGNRSIVIVKKIKETADKYPRHGSKIAKAPLL